MTDETLSALIDEGCSREATAKAEMKRVADIKETILKEKEPGVYTSKMGRTAQVTKPSATINPSVEAIAASREIIADDTVFRKAFNKFTSWKPVKDFRSVCNAVMSKPKAARVIAACETEAAGYVVFR